MITKFKISSPIDKLIYEAVRCLKCGAKMGECDCWSDCNIEGCTWFVEKGKKCNNPMHRKHK